MSASKDDPASASVIFGSIILNLRFEVYRRFGILKSEEDIRYYRKYDQVPLYYEANEI